MPTTSPPSPTRPIDEHAGWPDEVTIGILTALPPEADAVVSLLDDVGDFRDPRDQNRYRVGALPSADAGRPHLIAVLMMPKDGTRQAANYCANMLRTFPNIQTVIVTGIAGGLPRPRKPERHVRLGDIVVAVDGIVDYSHVRQEEGRTEPRGRQNSGLISHRLLRAARELQLEELSGTRRWATWLDPARNPQATRFERPGDETDVLYLHGVRVPHPERGAAANGVCQVHYGVIGSGDVLMRDEEVRDALAVRFPDMVAVEMEGSGIAASTAAEDRTWFMVRGVADYAETTGKNDLWHRFASYAAAAYVRALLEMTPAFPAAPVRPDERALPLIDPAGREEIDNVLLALPSWVDVRAVWHAAVPERPEPPAGVLATAFSTFGYLTGQNAPAAGLHPAIVFLGRLGQELGDDPAGAQLAGWATLLAEKTGAAGALRAVLDSPAGPDGADDAGPALLIEVVVDGIDRGACRITPYLQDRRGPWRPRPGPGAPSDVRVADLEEAARDLVEKAETLWGPSAERAGLEFVLPGALLNLPVQWFSGPRLFGTADPLCLEYPVIVRSLERMREPRVRRKWGYRWRQLDTKPFAGRVRWGEARTQDALLAWAAELTSDDQCAVVVLSAPPNTKWGRDELRAALGAGVPVILWDQRVHRPEDSTEGIRTLLGNPSMLPENTRRLRTTAVTRPEHFGRSVALLWDDPQRRLSERGAGS